MKSKLTTISHIILLTICSLFLFVLLLLHDSATPPITVSAASTYSLQDQNGNTLTSFAPTVISLPEHYDTPVINNYTSSSLDTQANLQTISDKSLVFTMPIAGRLDLTIEETSGKQPVVYLYNAQTNKLESTLTLEDGFERFVIDLPKDKTYRMAFDTSGSTMNIRLIFRVYPIMDNETGNKEYLPNTMYVFSKDYDNMNTNSTLYLRDNFIRIAVKQKSDITIYKRILAVYNPDAFLWPLNIYPCKDDYSFQEDDYLSLTGTQNLYSGSTYTTTLEPGIYYFNVGTIGSFFAFQYALTPYAQSSIDITPPTVTGVADNAIYKQNLILRFSDEQSGIYNAKLNGVKIIDGYQVDKDGVYTLTVSDKVDNKTTLHFTLDKTKPTVKGVKNNTSYKTKRTITFSETISGIRYATLNNKSIASGKKVTKLGTYVLKICDGAGNIKTIHFTIDSLPTISGVKSGGIYKSTRRIIFSDKDGIKSATLNGKKIFSGNWVSYSGKYTLKVADKKKNSTKITFLVDKIKPTVSGVKNGKTYKKPVKIKFSDTLSGIKKATLNKITVTSGKKISKKGTYRLEVYDKAGNTEIILFYIR